MYQTKVTRTRDGYFCRISRNDQPVVQAKVRDRQDIGPAFRDLLRTLDKMGGDQFTSKARDRIEKEGNRSLAVKHEWR